MKKRITKKALSIILAVVMMLQVSITAFAQTDIHDKTANPDIVRGLSLSYQLKSEGEDGPFHELTEPYKIDNPTEISTYRGSYSFSLKDTMDDVGQFHRTVTAGDYYLIPLPKEINITNPINGAITEEADIDRVITTKALAEYSFEQKADNSWVIKITFDSIVDDVNETEIVGNMIFDFKLDLSQAEAGKYTDIQIPIDNDKFITISVDKPVPPPTLPTKLEKSAASYNERTRELVWNVKMSPDTGVFENCVFKDTIDTAQCDFVSIKHGADILEASEFTYDDLTGSLEYKIPKGRNGKSFNTIQITVKVKSELYQSISEKTIANSATLEDDARLETPISSNTAEQKIKPSWLSKKGGVHQGNKISWTVTANTSRQKMMNAVVTDHLQPDISIDTSTLKVDGRAITVHTGVYTPSSDKEIYAVLNDTSVGKDLVIYFERGKDNASDKTREITFITDIAKASDPGDSAPVYNNTADMTAEFVGDDDGVYTVEPIASGQVGVDVPHVSVTKNASSLTSENKSSGTVDWNISAASNLVSYGACAVADTIAADQDFVSVKVDGVTLTDDKNQSRYYMLSSDGRTVTVVFSDYNAMDVQKHIVLRTKIKKDDYGYNFSNKKFKNDVTAKLYSAAVNSDVVAADSDNASVNVSNSVVSKKAVRYSGNTTESGEKPRMNFEITINKNQMPLNNVTLTEDFSALQTQYKKVGGKWETVNGIQWKLVEDSVKITNESGDSATDKWNIASIVKTYDEAGNKLNMSFGGNTVNDTYKVVLTLELDLAQNEIFKENGSIRCSQNKAILKADELKNGSIEAPPTGNSPEMSNILLGKFGEQSADDKLGQQISWTISLNQRKMTLESTEVVDVLEKGLTLDPTSVKLYTNVIDKNSEFKTGAGIDDCTLVTDFEYRYEPATQDGYEGRYKLTVILPDDSTDYILKFATDVDKSLLGKTISNTAFYKGKVQVPQNDSKKDVNVSSKPGGSSSRKISIDVRKFSSDTGEALNGAEFALHWLDGEKPVFVRNLTVTDNGTVTFYGLTKGEKYTLTETRAPDGYVIDNPAPVLVDTAALPDSLDFYDTPVKSGSWAPQAFKALNKFIIRPFDFTLTQGGNTVMTGTSKLGVASEQTAVDFKLKDGVDENDLFKFTDDFTFADSDPAGTQHTVLAKSFELSETDTELAGYGYDLEKRTINVNVTNVKGRENLKVVLTDKEGNVLSDDDGVFLADKIPTFTNTYSSTGSISLQAVKYLDGHKLDANAFEFELYDGTDTADKSKLIQTAKNGKGSTDGGNIYKGFVNFSKLNYNFEDVGVHTYTIVEKQASKPGYTQDDAVYTVKITVTDNDDGTLSTAVTELKKTVGGVTENEAEIAFTNLYRTSDKSLQLSGTKNLTGRVLEDKQFSFTLNEVDKNGTFVSEISNAVTHNQAGEIAFPVLTYKQSDIGKTYYYKLQENNTGAKGYTYDATVYDITVKVDDNHDGTLVLNQNVTVNAQTKAIEFSNVYKAEGGFTLPVTKTLEGKKITAEQFGFELVQCDESGAPVQGGLNQSVKNDENGNVSFDKITYDENDAGKTFYYTVSEVNAQSPGYTYDDNVYTVKAAVSDNGDGTLDVDYSVTSVDGKTDIAFENKYTVTDVIESFSVSKNLAGRVLEDGQFTFVMKQLDETGKFVKDIEAKTNDAKGNVTFSDITYTQSDMGKTYYYSVSETDDKKPGYTYDSSVYTFEVQVVDNMDGTLRTVKTIKHGEAEKKSAEFENVYKTSDISLQIKGVKKLSGASLSAGKFTFLLADESGNVLSRATNDADGTFAFDNIIFTQNDIGTHHFTVTEQNDEVQGMEYDKTEYRITVTVSDNGDGTLSAETETVEPTGTDEIVFTNTYTHIRSNTPGTGDNSKTAVYAVLLGLSLLALCIAVFARKKHKGGED